MGRKPGMPIYGHVLMTSWDVNVCGGGGGSSGTKHENTEDPGTGISIYGHKKDKDRQIQRYVYGHIGQIRSATYE